MKFSTNILLLLFVSSLVSHQVLAHAYGPYKVGKPYKTSTGKSFTPQEVSTLKQRGIASWYGKDFDGKMTANGGIFDSNLLTAAHRTLPMPSAVLITNVTNGKMAVVVVNDRGPFSDTESRLIDVSRQVAKNLGFLEHGRANVEMEYIPQLSAKLKDGQDITQSEIDDFLDSKKIQPAQIVQNINIANEFSEGKSIGKTVFNESRNGESLYVQAGVFEILNNAQELYKHLVENIPSVQIRSEKRDAKDFYVVRSGPFQTQQVAEASRTQIGNLCKDCNPMIVVIQ
jgi:rare lipoprotein A